MDNETNETLLEYAELDCTEWGETIEALVHLSKYKDYISDELAALLSKEIHNSLEYAKRHSTITKTTTTMTREVTNLEWHE